MQIEIWSDVVCPWCWVGKARFETAVDLLGWDDTDATVTYRPFELDPSLAAGSRPIAEYLRAKFGSAATVEAIEGRVSEAGAGVGLTFDWDRVIRVNTFDAHRLLTWALTEHGSHQQRTLKERLMRAYFAEGADVSEHGVLAGLAADTGLDAAAAADVLTTDRYAGDVRDEQARARTLGIDAVPTFVVEGTFGIPGAQDVETFVSLLPKLRQRLAETPDAIEGGPGGG